MLKALKNIVCKTSQAAEWLAVRFLFDNASHVICLFPTKEPGPEQLKYLW